MLYQAIMRQCKEQGVEIGDCWQEPEPLHGRERPDGVVGEAGTGVRAEQQREQVPRERGAREVGEQGAQQREEPRARERAGKDEEQVREVGEARHRGGEEEEPERGHGQVAAAAEDGGRRRRGEAGCEAVERCAEVVPRAAEVAQHAAERADELWVRVGAGAWVGARIRLSGRCGAEAAPAQEEVGTRAARREAARQGRGEQPGGSRLHLARRAARVGGWAGGADFASDVRAHRRKRNTREKRGGLPETQRVVEEAGLGGGRRAAGGRRRIRRRGEEIAVGVSGGNVGRRAEGRETEKGVSVLEFGKGTGSVSMTSGPGSRAILPKAEPG